MDRKDSNKIDWGDYKPYQPWKELEELKSYKIFNKTKEEKEEDNPAIIRVEKGENPPEVIPGRLWERRIHWEDE